MPTSLIVALCIAALIMIWAVRCIWIARRAGLAARMTSAVALAPVALFCLYGFAAAMEPGDYHVVWRVGYGTLFLTCLGAIVWLLLAGWMPERSAQDQTG